jgi:drug/metabolite transporter (DMT)-like permease
MASNGHVAPLKYIEVVFTVFFGLVLFGEVYTFWSLPGISFIIVGSILNVTYKEKKLR